MTARSWVGDEAAVVGLARIQPFDALDDATEAALRASIERFGVIVPVVRDQHGRILDGHHRDRLATELGVAYDERVVPVADENEAREVARTLNADRRHLTVEQRREVVAVLRQGGHSMRAIAGALGVSKGAVQNDVESQGVPASTPDETTGLDGKKYAATRPRAKRERGTTSPFQANSNHAKTQAAAHARRLTDGLSQTAGLCRGLAEIDYGKVAAAFTPDELKTWAAKAGELARALRAIRTHLLEVTDVQQAN